MGLLMPISELGVMVKDDWRVVVLVESVVDGVVMTGSKVFTLDWGLGVGFAQPHSANVFTSDT